MASISFQEFTGETYIVQIAVSRVARASLMTLFAILKNAQACKMHALCTVRVIVLLGNGRFGRNAHQLVPSPDTGRGNGQYYDTLHTTGKVVQPWNKTRGVI